MLFNSIQFLIFFPIVAVLYFLLPQKYRWIMLLAASYYFYMCWNWVYIFLIVGITLIDYFCAIWLEDAKKYRKTILAAVLITNLGLLFVYKYLGFAMSGVQSLTEMLGIPYVFPKVDIMLPVGISFFTFQTMAYFLDIYMGTRKAERHFGIFALFISFFPQLVAGPIERSTNLLPQFFEKHKPNYEDISTGLRLAAWGYFKKVVVADRAAELVNTIYNNPQGNAGWTLIIATVIFAFQIFCDFSGYSDIARGVARVLGYRLMRNFNRPYAAQSIADFWRRWHISLSTWFKDYIYIPLGGSRVSLIKWARNALIVFLLSGLWHGANWTFVIWGALLGAWQILERFSQPIRDYLWKLLGAASQSIWGVFMRHIRGLCAIGVTFAFVCFTWIFFRANSVSDAFYIVNHLGIGLTKANLRAALDSFGEPLNILTASIIVLELGQWLAARKPVARWAVMARWGAYAGLMIWILIYAQYGSQQFIYFQF